MPGCISEQTQQTLTWQTRGGRDDVLIIATSLHTPSRTQDCVVIVSVSEKG